MPPPLQWKSSEKDTEPVEFADESVARCFYPGVIKQGDKSIGPIAIARARLERAEKDLLEARYDRKFDLFFETDEDKARFYDARAGVDDNDV